FTYSAKQAIQSRDSSDSAVGYGRPSANGANDQRQTNGISHYGGTLTDKGTMTVDIAGRQADGGLVVSISEQGEGVRKAPPATCVVYGNTNVICDPYRTVYTEEYTLLRFLGANFVDPNQMDPNKHWRIGPSTSQGQTTQADYSITSSSGGKMQIGETRKVVTTGSGKLETDIEAKVGYDYDRTVPTSVDEYATQRTDAGVSGTSTTTYQTTLALVSDTIATKP
ncbi:MAG TPA: hypothetical protein VHR97_00855, partial [Candidatus Baltobacteraceae bacterium]|nr:hypothetical protein [Candidatus Baltobacteraceae bacterium]